MLKNYIKLAFRNIIRNKIFSIINITGLAIGLAVSFCIMIYVMHELSYDKMHHNRDSIYRIDTYSNGQEFWQHQIPNQIVEKAIVPLNQLNKVALTFPIERLVVRNSSITLNISKNYCVDKNFFDLFDIDILFGAKLSTHIDPLSVLISRDLSQKLFGRVNSVGETLELNKEGKDEIQLLTIAGVFENNLERNSLGAEIYLSIENKELLDGSNKSFIPNVSAFILSDPLTDINYLEELITKKCKEFKDYVGISYHLIPLNETYFIQGDYFNGYDLPYVNLDKLYLYSAIAAIILLMACFNYLILSTSKFLVRNKEIGIRKVIGARRRELIFQILLESIITVFISLPLAVLFVEILMPFMGEIVNKEISNGFYHRIDFLIISFVVTIIVGILGGLYTAFTFSKQNPILIFRNKFFNPIKRYDIRKVLITVQMTMFIGLLVAALVLNFQMKFISEKDLGFNNNNTLTIYSFKLGDKQEAYFNAIKNYTGIEEASFASTSRFPFQESFGVLTSVANVDDPSNEIKMQRSRLDIDELKLLDIKLAEGTLGEKLNLKWKILINETAAKALGFKEPVGKMVKLNGRVDAEIIGVVKDFNFNSLHSSIKPLLLFPAMSDNPFSIIIKYQSNNLYETIAFLKDEWAKLSETEFSYVIQEDYLAELYASEWRSLKAVNFFTAIAILISMMGLFGLLLFVTQQKTKEIGIRKVLGASLANIFSMLTKDYLILGFVGLLISSPIAYYFMQDWLNNFAYKIDFGFNIIFYAGLVSIAITLLTISLQVIKAAIANPVESLRNE